MAGIADIILGIFGGSTSNPNEWARGKGQQYEDTASGFLDPNNPFYQTIKRYYFNDLSKTLNETTPTANSLLALSTAYGGKYGGSQTIANEQRKAIEQRNQNVAYNASNTFSQNMYGQGLDLYKYLSGLAQNFYSIYGEGNVQSMDAKNSFADQLIKLVGGAAAGIDLGSLSKGSSSGGSFASGLNDMNPIMKEYAFSDMGLGRF